jgi:uncharacterized protein YecE (DUF72 family)
MSLRIGTSGWSYPSGPGTWNGIFYPKTRSKNAGTAGFDELRFYAEHFDTVEVNSTFYGQPRADVTSGWASRTPQGFEFSLKLYQKFTHPKMFREAALKTAPGTEGPLLDLLAQVTRSDIDDFRAGIDPLVEAGRLGALLAQFPASFKASPESRQYLQWLLEAFRAYPVTLELRHKSWSDDPEEVFDVLNEYGAAWTQIDEPKFRFSIRQDWMPNVRSFFYMRLHGRNAEQWWRHERSEDRYNYLYSEAELKPFAHAINSARAQVKKLYTYLNNHFAGQAVADAAVLRHLLDEPVTAPMPAELVERYPMLQGKVATSPPSRLL